MKKYFLIIAIALLLIGLASMVSAPETMPIIDENYFVPVPETIGKIKIELFEIDKNATIMPKAGIVQLPLEKRIVFNTPVVSLDSENGKEKIKFKKAKVTLPIINGKVNTIFKCEDFDHEKFECFGEWEKTNIEFKVGFNEIIDANGESVFVPNGTVSFDVNSFSAYGGGIIVVIKAEHLDENRAFVSDIYGQVRKRDGAWSEKIQPNEYVRVTFADELNQENDITVFARSLDGNATIGVYRKGSDELIASISGIGEENWYKTFLNELEGNEDEFDLKVFGNAIEFDYIVDPTMDDFEDGTIDKWTADITLGGTMAASTSANKFGSYGGRMTTNGAGNHTNIFYYNLTGIGAGAFNVYTWIRMSDASGLARFTLYDASFNQISIGIQLDKFWYYTEAVYDQYFTATASDNTWYRLRIAFDGTYASFYVYDTSNNLIESHEGIAISNGTITQVRLRGYDWVAGVQTIDWDNTSYSNTAEPTNLDTNIWRVDGWDTSKTMPAFSYTTDGNLTIDFNVATDTNFGVTWADLNYSATNTQGSGTQIVKGLVVDGNRCQTNFIGDWNNQANSDVNLVGYWKFDAQEDVNTIRAFDYSGKGNQGQYINGADNNATGKWDTNAAWFDGLNDYIEIASAQDMNDLNGSFTLSTWFNANGSQNRGAEILSRTGFFWIGYDYTGNLEFALRDQNKTGSQDQNYNSMDNVYKIKRITTTVTNNQWNHVVATSDGTNISLYLNGALQASGTVKQTLNPYCIDQYEASHSDATFCANSTTWSGGCSSAYGSLSTPASAPDRIPWTTVSQTAASTACTAAGKHLCSSAEWMAAANLNGQVYDLSDATTQTTCIVDSTLYCLDHSDTSGEACNTGSNKTISPSNCKSSQGVYDMIGNVWEWTSDVVDVNSTAIATNYPNDAVSPNLWGNETKSLHYGNDTVYTGATKTGRTVLRGGSWDYTSHAGLFSVHLYYDPADTSYRLGFRCCDAPTTYNVCDANMAFINPSIKMGYDTNAFKGQIEETKIYHRALTANEILLDYDSGTRNFRTCSYDWNILGISDANYYANVLVRDDAGNSDYNSSNNNFRVNPSGAPPSDSCSCPISGNWEIINGDHCKLTTPCWLTAGSLNIDNGSLEVDTVSGGRLFWHKGYHARVSKTNGKLMWGKA